MLYSGAEAVLSSISFAGRKMLMKKRIAKKYREKILDEKLRKTRTKREVKLLNFVKKFGIRCPVVYYVGDDYFLMNRVNGKLLRDFLNAKNKKILKKIGEMASKMHSVGVVHGDFTTANIIVSAGTPVIIDFGLGNFSNEIEEKAIDLLLMKRSLPFGFDIFISSYINSYPNKKLAEKIVKHISEIEKRARYVQR